MAKKKTSIAEALSKSARGEDPSRALQVEKPQRPLGASAPAKPGRVGKVNITGYFDPAVKKSIRLIQAHDPERTVQDLLAEALNDLFAKYNVPQTAFLSGAGIEDRAAE
jgi:hypothetical protein